MTLIVHEGLFAKTLPAGLGAPYDSLTIATELEDETIPVEAMLADVRLYLERDDMRERPEVAEAIAYFAGMEIVEEDCGQPVGKLSVIRAREGEHAPAVDNSAIEPFQVAGAELNWREFTGLLDYIMTNNPIYRVDDPRLLFRDRLRRAA